MEQSSCPSSINEAQLNWQRVREEHEMKKMQTSAMNKVGPMADPGVPTMMVQGKPAVMVHPVSAPRPMNSSNSLIQRLYFDFFYRVYLFLFKGLPDRPALGLWRR